MYSWIHCSSSSQLMVAIGGWWAMDVLLDTLLMVAIAIGGWWAMYVLLDTVLIMSSVNHC